MRLRILFEAVSAVTVLLIGALAAAAAPQHQKALPAWSTDLRSVVGSAPLPYVLGGGNEANNSVPVTSLLFKDNDTVVATYVVQSGGDNPKLSKRGEDQNLPLLLRALFVDAGTGRITATRDWPSDSRHAIVVTAPGGEVVAQTGDELTLYGKDLEKVKSIRLPPPAIGFWGATPSLSGENILLSELNTQNRRKREYRWLWLRTDTLEIVRSWDAQPVGPVSITDDEILLSTWCDYVGCQGLEVRGVSTDWNVIGPGYTEPTFVNESTFFLRGAQTQNTPVKLVRTNGETIFSDKQPSEGGVRWDRPVVSSEGRRFVAPGLRAEGGSQTLDVDGHSVLKTLLVYDLLAPQQPQVLDVGGPAIKDFMQFALSPDGSRLAILNNEILEVFDLPPLPPGHSNIPSIR